MFIEFLILLTTAGYLFYRWATVNNDFFDKRGIPYSKPTFLFGNFTQMILRQKPMFDIFIELYRESKSKVYGVFDQRQPIFFLRDPEIIKNIAIKDFDHFVNHRSILNYDDEDTDHSGNLFGASLFLMKDAKWKDMRSTLSPAFTGSKLRQTFQLMNEVAQETLAFLKNKESVYTKDGLDIEVKDFITRFTNDIIASTAFGLKINSYKDENNEFYMMGKEVTTFTFQSLKFALLTNFKTLMKLLNIQLFDKELKNYFMRLVLDAMKYRQENNITRPDMINMLMEAKGLIQPDNAKPITREWSDVDIVAQCFLFFFAGFETSAALTCLTAHEIMENIEVQEKLLEEIKEVEQSLEGRPLTYVTLQNMRYMDMVVQECLRKWPGATAIDRVCNKDITYNLDNGERLELKKGDMLWIPVAGLHRDPRFFENPDKFDPERFSEKNKHKIKPFTYLPFGVGPRNCIGSRFALLETKVIIYYLVRDFHLDAAKNSCIPLKLSPKGFQLIPERGFWLKFTARSNV